MFNVRKLVVWIAALSLLLGGGALISTVQAAPWIAPAAEVSSYQADWVASISDELSNNDDLRWIFTNDPRAPQSKIVRLLNQAAVAMKEGNTELAKDFVDRALEIVKRGVDRGYYSPEDESAVEQMILKHLPKALV